MAKVRRCATVSVIGISEFVERRALYVRPLTDVSVPPAINLFTLT